MVSQGDHFCDPRRILEGIIYRYRCGIPWRDLPEYFGPWKTVYHRYNQLAKAGTFDVIVNALIAQADASGHD
ncbi:transposase [Corynebacterium cystitidis]|uniref:transposase n=1 Tax=Corynebacterium cystitidis TaxID=35757 RepID=UPI00211E1699|nr:transposase [Corynebacterium cystitidis]